MEGEGDTDEHGLCFDVPSSSSPAWSNPSSTSAASAGNSPASLGATQLNRLKRNDQLVPCGVLMDVVSQLEMLLLGVLLCSGGALEGLYYRLQHCAALYIVP